MKQLILSLTLALLAGITSCSAKGDEVKEDEAQQHEEMTQQRLQITVGNRVLTARLYDNATTRSFIAQLPLTVDMDDYAGAEKIFYPNPKLSTTERNAVSDPAIGDINCYAPWGNIAIFYRGYGTDSQLYTLGHIESGKEKLAEMRDNFTAVIERVD